MKILEYTECRPPRNEALYDKVRQATERDHLRTADVKKLANLAHGKFYRAKLDYDDRLLFSTIRSQGEVYALMLEVIEQHAYDKSRFLRGAHIDDAKIPAAETIESSGSIARSRRLVPACLASLRASFASPRGSRLAQAWPRRPPARYRANVIADVRHPN
jgi:hypothetical protein